MKILWKTKINATKNNLQAVSHATVSQPVLSHTSATPSYKPIISAQKRLTLLSFTTVSSQTIKYLHNHQHSLPDNTLNLIKTNIKLFTSRRHHCTEPWGKVDTGYSGGQSHNNNFNFGMSNVLYYTNFIKKWR